jgi:hypothetical protein
LQFDDGPGTTPAIEYPDHLFEPPPSWARRHPFGARIVALTTAFALLAPLAAAYRAWAAGGDDAAPPSSLSVVLDDAVPADGQGADATAPATDAAADAATAPDDDQTGSAGDVPADPVLTVVPADPVVTVVPSAPASTTRPPSTTVVTSATRGTVAPTRPATTKPATTTRVPATTATTRPLPPRIVPSSTTTTRPAPTTTTAPPKVYGPAELEAMVRAAFPADPETAVTIAQRESGLNPNARNGWCCYGLFQINFGSHRSWLAGLGVTRPEQLLDAALNIKVATLIYLRAGGWSPWSTAP